jgi:hypothetical protein
MLFYNYLSYNFNDLILEVLQLNTKVKTLVFTFVPQP